MRKYFCFIGLCALSILSVSCASSKIINSATYTEGAAKLYVTPLQADLEVSAKKINYFMPVSDAIGQGGLKNVISTAIKEALDANGGDVIVGLETSVSYSDNGSIESISITGYPASFINFRSNNSLPLVEADSGQGNGKQGDSFLNVLNLKKSKKQK